jgi:hypothetical protein
MPDTPETHGQESATPARTEKRNVMLVSVALGRMPAPFTHVGRKVARFKRWVELELLKRDSGITAWQAKRLKTCCAAMRRAEACEKTVNDAGKPGKGAELSHEQWLAYCDRIVRYNETADRALKDLGLDRQPDQWDQMLAGHALPVSGEGGSK